jgi:hypothetical protein
MSEEEKSAGEASGAATAAVEPSGQQESGDEHTTAPNPTQKPAQWTMPKPVFKQTSGYLPQGYLKDMQEAARTNPDSENTTQEQSPMFGPRAKAGPDLSAVDLTPPAAAVEPQPELSEQLIHDEPAHEDTPAVPEKRSSRMSMALLGVIVFLAFVAVFLTAVYFLFLKGNGDTNNF